ncbi:uncharacterized protein LOC126668598 [Mercurialis annua]|uniref:uncharacterized protein LOC126668598 n=1 Tax=Mercurialis annua TaxID=3986 RepID=UPI0021602168|nr:uncharacterized protein LOC126668598 [Mercurialis annua]
MASSSLTKVYSRTVIAEEEDEGLDVAEVGEGIVEEGLEWCLIFAGVWKPVHKVSIEMLESNLFLFKFYHEMDMKRVVDDGPWTFEQNLLITKRLVILSFLYGYATEKIGENIGNFVGRFVACDLNPVKGTGTKSFRIRASLDNPVPKEFLPYGTCMRVENRKPRVNTGDQWLRPTSPSRVTYEDDDVEVEDLNGRLEENLVITNHNIDLNLNTSKGRRKVGQTSDSSSLIAGKNLNSNYLTDLSLAGKILGEGDELTLDSKRKRLEAGLAEGFGGIGPDFQKEAMIIDPKIDSVGRSGGLVLFWKGSFDVEIISSCASFIDVVVSNGEGGRWRLTGYYGFPERHRRRDSWQLLKDLSSQSHLPWCILGDFNDLLCRDEKRGGRGQPMWMINGFRETILECGLIDIGAKGHKFTWERGRGTNGWIEERLDRVLCNNDWKEMFSSAEVCNLSVSTSDHKPILTTLARRLNCRMKKRFKSWGGLPGDSLSVCISKTSKALESWSGNRLPNFSKMIEAKKLQIDRLQGRRDENSMNNYIQSTEELHSLLEEEEEETYWRQRAKSFWMKAGDSNSKFFHSAASVRKRRNRLLKLRDDDGNWKHSEEEINDTLRKYFVNLFVGNGSNPELVEFDVDNTVTDDQNESLVQPITEEEVRRAAFSMHNEKAPGPDGLNPAFYKRYWSIVGADVVLMCMKFMETGKLEVGLNDTCITLIPKSNDPEFVTDLRPISLCNVAYKILSKVLANRMKHLMPCIISDTQSAFVEGRLITDNFLVAYEIGHFLKRKRRGKLGVAALKIDMSKAYDRFEWGFVRIMLLKMGFTIRWVDLLIECVSTVWYVAIGDSFSGDPIVPIRGLRQGDPLSPYLFTVCAEGLSRLLAMEERRGRLHGVSICRGSPAVSHLLFADDCYFFFRASNEEAEVIKSVLGSYESMSGKKVNLHKTSILLSRNVVEELKCGICEVLGVVEVDNHGKYLGLPSLVGRNKREIFNFIKDKVWHRVKGWSSKALSRGGKEILLKTVAQSIPNYVMNVFLIPLDLCGELERMMNSFWWGRNREEKKGICWASWDRLCKTKKFGGMGFKKIHDFNIAMLSRQAWRLINNGNCLMSKVFKAKYFPYSSFLQAKLGSNPSYVWRSIWSTQKVMVEGVRVCIGDGHNTEVWKDPWILNEESGYLETNALPHLEGCKVWQLFQSDKKAWDEEILGDLFFVSDQMSIKSIPLSVRDRQDSWVWIFDKKKRFSVKSVYRRLRGEVEADYPVSNDFNWNILWNLQVPLHVRSFIWRVASGFLPTVDALARKCVFVNSVCQVCCGYNESVEHLLFQCEYAVKCWSLVKIHGLVGKELSIKVWCRMWLEDLRKEEKELVAMVCWRIWLNRNNVVWGKAGLETADLVNMASQQLCSWKRARKEVDDCVDVLGENGDGLVVWKCPAERCLKANVDAAIFSSLNSAAIGVVVRDDRGDIIRARQVKFVGKFDPRTDELMGIREALSWLKGWENVTVESDAMDVILDIRNPSRVPGDLLVEDCVFLAKQLPNVSFVYVRRSANQAAHLLARNACSLSGYRDWFSNYPKFLLL